MGRPEVAAVSACPPLPPPPHPTYSPCPLHLTCTVPVLNHYNADFACCLSRSACHLSRSASLVCPHRLRVRTTLFEIIEMQRRKAPDGILSESVKCCGCVGHLCSLMTSGSCLLMTGWTTSPSASAQSGKSSWNGVEDPHWSVPLTHPPPLPPYALRYCSPDHLKP